MAGWKPKNGLWFSPRAIKEPAKLVEEVQTGPNSFRYSAVKPKDSSRLVTGLLDQGPSASDYLKNLKRGKKKKNKGVTNPGFGRVSKVYNQWAEDAYGDEVMVHYNTPRFSSPVYTFSAARWANWSYGGYYTPADTDANENMFVKEPESYLTPTVNQIQAKVNYTSHKDLKQIKELARVCYFKMIDDKEYISKEFEDEHNSPIGSDEWRRQKAIYDNVYETFIPGFSPLDQAIAISHKLHDIESRNRRRGSPTKHDGGQSFEFRRDDYRDPDINTQLDMNDLSKKYKMDILNRISILGDFGSQFKVEKAVGEKEVPNSDIRRTKLMRSYEQISMIEKYQLLMPNFDLKFASKDLLVSVPVSCSEQKQKIIILCDYSGSMNRDSKQMWVNAILTDRFRYVMRGEAEVFFSFFVSSTSELFFTHVKNAEDVKNFWKTFSNYPGGNMTNIGRIVEYVADEIIYKKKLHNLKVDLSSELPEILIINDGEDEVGYSEFPYKVNAVSLVGFSTELKNLCIASGGKQIQVTSDNIITAYSSTGKEIIAD